MIDCKAFGTRTFLIPKAMNPAKNPVMIPPKNPAFASLPYNAPFAANIPPTNPGTSPGRSAILCAINADRIGTINPIAILPILFIVAQIVPSGILIPSGVAVPPNVKEIAINNPPVTTKGTMYETPFIKLL